MQRISSSVRISTPHQSAGENSADVDVMETDAGQTRIGRFRQAKP